MPLVKLTPTFIKKTMANPPKKSTRYMDEAFPTFGVTISPKGRASFIAQYYLHGKQVGPNNIEGGAVTDTDPSALLRQIKEMRRIADSYNRDARAGIDPFGKVVEVSKITLGSHMMDYIRTHAMTKKRKSSISKDVNLIDNHTPEWMKRSPLSEITKADVMKHHSLMHEMKPTANSWLRMMSKVYNLAIDWGLTEVNPVRGITMYEEHPRERYLSPEEITRLDDALNHILNQKDDGNIVKQHPAAAAIKLIMLTGSRKSEVFSAEWSMFDLNQAIWSKPYTHTKQKKTVHIPLSPEAVDVLRLLQAQQTKPSRWLFPSPTGNGHISDIKTFWAKFRKDIGLDNVRMHDLRHTYASVLVQNGVDPTAIQILMGHSKIDTTMRYMHRRVDHLRDAASAFTKGRATAQPDDDSK